MVSADPSPANRTFNRFTSGPAIVLYIAAGKLALHLLTANRYGIFRDEMYYWAGSLRMDWGYVDHPPLTVWLAWFARHAFGNSPLGVRLLPALAGSALVWLTGKLTREMGGGRFAQALAALAVVVVPVYLVSHHWLTDNAWEPLIWMGCVWLVVRSINSGDARYWVWFGVLAGVGFENKYSIAFLLFGLMVGMVLTPYRHFLKSRYLWLGALACAVIALPNFLWQVMYHFPFLELIYRVRVSNRDVVRGPVAFIADQATILNPALFPLWVGGVIWLFVGQREEISDEQGHDRGRYRMLAWAFLVVLSTFIVLKAKNYYVAPIYPMLFAAGAIGLERITQSSSNRRMVQNHLHWNGDRSGQLAVAVLRTSAVAGELPPLSKRAWNSTAGVRKPAERPLTAVVCRRIRLARNGRKGCTRLQQPSAGGAGANSHILERLGRGGSGRFLRSAVRPAPGHQQAQ